MRALGPSVWVAALQVACTRSPHKADGAALSAADAATGVVGNDAGPVSIHLEVNPGDGGGILYAVVSGATGRVALARVAAPFACETMWSGRSTGSTGDPSHDTLLVACAPGERSALVRVEGQSLNLYGALCGKGPAFCVGVPLAGAAPVIDSTIAPPPPACSDDIKASRVDVLFARRPGPEGQGRIEMRVPALDVRMDLVDASKGVFCSGFAPRPRSFEVECVGTRSDVVRFRVRDGAIHGTWRVVATETDLLEPLPSIVLPCGAQVKWQAFEAWEPAPSKIPLGWTGGGFNDACSCIVAQRRCDHRCYDRWADDDGDLAGEGQDCSVGCLHVVCPCTGRKM
jgi:hypothetical protein